MTLVTQTCHNWTTVIPQQLTSVEWSDNELNELARLCQEYYHEIFDTRILCNREKDHCYEILSGKPVDNKGHPIKGGAIHVEISDMFLWGLGIALGILFL